MLVSLPRPLHRSNFAKWLGAPWERHLPFFANRAPKCCWLNWTGTSTTLATVDSSASKRRRGSPFSSSLAKSIGRSGPQSQCMYSTSLDNLCNKSHRPGQGKRRPRPVPMRVKFGTRCRTKRTGERRKQPDNPAKSLIPAQSLPVERRREQRHLVSKYGIRV